MRGNQRGVWWPIEGEPRSGRGSLHAFSSQRVLSARGVLAITAQLGLVACLFAVIAAVLSVGPLRFDHALTGGVCALGSSGHKRTSVRTLRPTPIRCNVDRKGAVTHPSPFLLFQWRVDFVIFSVQKHAECVMIGTLPVADEPCVTPAAD